SAALVGENRGADARRGGAGLRFGISYDLSERALPGDPDENRAPDRGQLVDPAQQFEVVLDRLAEADPRVEADRLLPDSLRNGECEPLVEEAGDLGDDVLVARGVLHRPRLALHVHETDVGAVLGDDACELGVAAKGG